MVLHTESLVLTVASPTLGKLAGISIKELKNHQRAVEKFKFDTYRYQCLGKRKKGLVTLVPYGKHFYSVGM